MPRLAARSSCLSGEVCRSKHYLSLRATITTKGGIGRPSLIASKHINHRTRVTKTKLQNEGERSAAITSLSCHFEQREKSIVFSKEHTMCVFSSKKRRNNSCLFLLFVIPKHHIGESAKLSYHSSKRKCTTLEEVNLGGHGRAIQSVEHR